MDPTRRPFNTVRRAGKLTAASLCLGVAALLLAFAPVVYADPPTTAADQLTGWQGSAFSIYLNCSAGTTNGDEMYVTRSWMDWESPDEHSWADESRGVRLWIF
jgi:hypothetical protein